MVVKPVGCMSIYLALTIIDLLCKQHEDVVILIFLRTPNSHKFPSPDHTGLR